MNKFDENLSEGNYISFKNKSATPFLKGKISIENIDYYSKKVRINSPRSLYAMSKLGVKNQELEYLTFKEYLHKYPQLVGRTKEIQRIKYNNVEEIRKRAIDQIRNLRSEISDEVKPVKKRCFSSKLRSTQNAYFNSSLKINDLKSTFKDKDIRNFNRIRNNNKAELMIRMQLELKKELIKKLKNEKEKEKNKEKLKKEKEIFEIKKELIKLNALKDEERIRKERAQIISAKKEEEKIIKEKMIKEENNYKELKKRIKQKKKIRDQKDNDRYEFLKNIYSMRESDRLRLSEKQNKAHKKIEKFIKRIENDRREIIMKKSKILQDKKDKVDQNIKIIEYKQEQKRADYEEKLKEEQEKKIEEEILLKKQKEEEEEEKNNMFEIELEKRLRMVREENEHENNLKTSKNLEKQDDFEEKRNEDLNEEKFSELEKKELKQKENYYRIELQLNQRKEDIMNKIFKKEIDVEKAREEKEKLTEYELISLTNQANKKVEQLFPDLCTFHLPKILRQNKEYTIKLLYDVFIEFKTLLKCSMIHNRNLNIHKKGIDFETFYNCNTKINQQGIALSRKIFKAFNNKTNVNYMPWQNYMDGMMKIKDPNIDNKLDLFFQILDENGDGSFDYNEVFNLSLISLQRVLPEKKQSKNNSKKSEKDKENEEPDITNILAEFLTKYVFQLVGIDIDGEIPIDLLREKMDEKNEESEYLEFFLCADNFA